NVVAKVGGIQMVVNGYGWHERQKPPTSDELLAANRDWYLYTIDHFGPSRCMFESNFPVDRLSCSYTVVWNQFKKLTKGFSASERAAMVATGAPDVGGVVTSSNGPEDGVWVIAETTELPTKFAKAVVTDDQGRYVIPELPKATYNVWVRGYGLVDSQKVKARPGQH